ncbi:hypothetical protein BMS3Abin03_03010 [bacterium BMS3Abin03]|nr:hypothetical protein BMS3Abin03_03010 [bacterium BMS3Abin03]
MFNINLYGQDYSQNKLDEYFNKFLLIRAPELLSVPAESIKINYEEKKCGLDIVNFVALNINKYSADQKKLFEPLLQRPPSANSFVTPGGFFRVHYDLSGPNAVAYDLDLLAEALDSTYRFEINFLKYDPPPGDSAYNPTAPPDDYGGDNLYDVYIANLGSGFYGYTQFEVEIEPGSARYTSYMMIDNDFLNYYSSGINGARVTVAHEFHHSIQGGNYIFRQKDVFFYELTSTSMEEFVFDSVNDYYAYIHSYFSSLGTPLPLTTGYNSATWNIFLRDNFGYNIIKRQWELMPSVRAIIAINNSLFKVGSSFSKEFNKYGTWTFFTNYRAVPGKYFEEGANYPLVKQTSFVSFTPPSKLVRLSSRAAAQSLITFVVASTGDSLVAIISNGDVQNAIDDNLNNFFDFDYTLFSDSTSGERFLTPDYSSDFSANNPAFWSVSEILNNIIVREDNNINLPTTNDVSYAYPSPFNYEKNYLFGSFIFIPFSGELGETVDFNVYTSSMRLAFKSTEPIKFLPGEQKGIIWNGLDETGEKLATGVYIYVIRKDDDVFKGKVVILK